VTTNYSIVWSVSELNVELDFGYSEFLTIANVKSHNICSSWILDYNEGLMKSFEERTSWHYQEFVKELST